MIWLTSEEIVEAVRRSLLDHVLPAVTEEYARVQVHAAALALEEVATRLESSDPVAAENARFPEILRGLGLAVPGKQAQTAKQQRAYNAAVRNALSAALATAGRDGAAQLLTELSALEREASKADARWISAEAIASLE